MALTRIGLATSLTTNTACTDVAITDTTGIYPTVATGYGMPSGATVNSVTSLIITVNMNGGIYFTYTFVINNGVITSCLLSINGGTGTEIVTLLASTTFPVTSFSLFSTTYGVTLPTLADGVLEVDYNIIGNGGDDPTLAFSYLNSETILIECSICCCLQKQLLNLDVNCCDNEDNVWNYIRASTYLEIAEMNMNIGKTDTAQIALDKSTEICNCGCKSC